MARTLTLLLTLLPGSALAHAGHLGELAGHDHWVAGAALGAAALGALWAAWKGRREAEAEVEDADGAPDGAEGAEA